MSFGKGTLPMNFLLSSEAAVGRLQRFNGYPKIGEVRPTIAVHVEYPSGFIELDADDEKHAHVILEQWILRMGCMSGRYHYVADDGSLTKASPIYDFRDYRDDFQD